VELSCVEFLCPIPSSISPTLNNIPSAVKVATRHWEIALQDYRSSISALVQLADYYGTMNRETSEEESQSNDDQEVNAEVDMTCSYDFVPATEEQ